MVRKILLPEPLDEAARMQMLKRLQDYEPDSLANPENLRALLIARWRAAHPEAAVETSPAFRPLMKFEEYRKDAPSQPDEFWFSDVYQVSVRRHKKDPVFGSGGGMVQLGISSHDGTARHDWRDLQQIKNAIAGPECEAFELFPAESRLLDPSNYYTIWAFPGVKRLRIGNPDRLVRDADMAWAPQRALPKEEDDAG